MVFHGYNQVKKSGKLKLFRSHKPDFSDGEQVRDFIYVLDIAKLCFWLLDHKIESGLYNLGTGKARSFNELARAVFECMGRDFKVEYIDIPRDIRDKYQYFTEADMHKLHQAGYDHPFCSLEEGVKEYITKFLQPSSYY
jgi:ADP-L-glycero-D-manno-heptose 6-epimerase